MRKLDFVLPKLYIRARRAALSTTIFRVRKAAGCLNWGVVGTGHMASTWADLLLGSRIGRLRAVCSRSAARANSFARKFGCELAYGHVDEMLRKEAGRLDMVYLATPLDSHASLIRECIDAGVGVLTEKPATRTAEQWAELTAFAKRRNVLLVEGMWMRCLPAHRQAETWIEEGKIGTIRLVKADLNKFIAPTASGMQPVEGVMMDFGVYALSFICNFLGGKPEWHQAESRYDESGHDRDWTIIARRGDRSAVVNLSQNSHSTSRAMVIGDLGIIEWQSPFNRTNQISLYTRQSRQRVRKTFLHLHGGYDWQLQEVTKAFAARSLESSLLSHDATFNTLKLADELLRAREHD